MIFITLGSQKFQFNRLLKAVDTLIDEGKINERVIAQVGYSDYKPKHIECKQFLDRDYYRSIIDKVDIVITHGGTGAIVGSLKQGKKVIAVPRLSKYGEHVDDHQKQIVLEFSKKNLIYGLENCGELASVIRYVRGHKFEKYESNTEKIIESIKDYIDSIQ